jgi:hypothetical protein
MVLQAPASWRWPLLLLVPSLQTLAVVLVA